LFIDFQLNVFLNSKGDISVLFLKSLVKEAGFEQTAQIVRWKV